MRHSRLFPLLILPALQVLLCLSSCTTPSLTATTPTDASSPALAAARRQTMPWAPIAAPLASHHDCCARFGVNLSYNDHVLPLKGNLRMRRGEVMQLSLTALGMVEIARVEFTPKSAYFIDRLGKNYAVVAYDQLPTLGQAGFTYDLLESLLWHELFLPGQKKGASRLAAFVATPVGDEMQIAPKEQKALQAFFYSDAHYGHLLRTRLQLGPLASTWSYDSFLPVGDSQVPAKLGIQLQTAQKAVGADFAFSAITLDDDSWTTRTNIANYSVLSIDEFFQKLSFLK